MGYHQQPMGCGLPPTSLWAVQVGCHLSACGLLGSSLRACHKAFQGGCGLYVGSAYEPKEIINNLFFSSILLGDFHNFIN